MSQIVFYVIQKAKGDDLMHPNAYTLSKYSN